MVLEIGIIYFLYILVKVYVSVMEIGYVSRAKHLTPVILDTKRYKDAADYKIASQRMDILNSLFDYVLFIFWVGFGLRWLDNALHIDNVLLKSVVYIDLFIAINYLLSLPFEIYGKFYLDKKFGFSNMTAKMFITDLIKAAVLFLIFGSLIVYAVSYIIITFSLWWLWSFVFIFAIIVIINLIYPTFIAPMFNKFTPLEDEDLKESIENLMEKAGLKSSGIFTMDASKRDNRLNAYFGGLGSSKRVVLFDTLIKKLSKTELLAVLGHELGHFKHKDIIKNIFMMGGLLFLMFFIFGNLPDSLFLSFGLYKTPYTIIAFFLLLSPIVAFVFMPVMGLLSRHNEYAADEYGSECESPEVLASALEKLANENKSFPRSHPLFIFFYFTHPPLVERLKRLGKNYAKGDEALKEECKGNEK
jgi:STE24 endopeptidase